MNLVDNRWPLFLSVFALLGIIFLSISFYTWRTQQALKANGIETTGQVIDHIQGWRDQHHRSTAMAVVVHYFDWQNQPRIYRSNTYTTPVLFQIGETVRLWYQKDNPDNVLLAGKDEWLLVAIFGGFGLIFSLIGLPGVIKELSAMLFA